MERASHRFVIKAFPMLGHLSVIEGRQYPLINKTKRHSMRLKRTALGSLFLALFCFTATSLFVTPTADAAKKKSQAVKKAAPGAGPSEKEKKLLAMSTSYPSSYAI